MSNLRVATVVALSALFGHRANATIQACKLEGFQGRWVFDSDNQPLVRGAVDALLANRDCLVAPALPQLLKDLDKPGIRVCVSVDPQEPRASTEYLPGQLPIITINPNPPPLPQNGCTELNFPTALGHELAHVHLLATGTELYWSGFGYDPNDTYATYVENEYRRGQDMCVRTQYRTKTSGIVDLPAESQQRCECGKAGPIQCSLPGASSDCGCTDTDAICCQGSCEDKNDPLNCGSCTSICTPLESCCSQQCVLTNSDADCGACGITCSLGTHCCNATCLNTNSDAANCGACGHACAAGQVCTNGACTCPGGACDAAHCCGGQCLDVATDPDNCGSCAHHCIGSQAPDGVNSGRGQCLAGVCQYSCSGGFTLLGWGQIDDNGQSSVDWSWHQCRELVLTPRYGSCNGVDGIDVNHDQNNCNGCGNACRPGSTCSTIKKFGNGLPETACMCPFGQRVCPGDASSQCVNVEDDPSHCGFDCRTCAGGMRCRDGVCEQTP